MEHLNCGGSVGRLVRADDLGRPDVQFRVASALRATPKKRGFTVGSHNGKEYRKTRAKATTPPVAGDSHATDTFLRWVVNAGLKNDGHDAIDREAASGYSADESISRRSARFRRFPVPTGPVVAFPLPYRSGYALAPRPGTAMLRERLVGESEGQFPGPATRSLTRAHTLTTRRSRGFADSFRTTLSSRRGLRRYRVPVATSLRFASSL